MSLVNPARKGFPVSSSPPSSTRHRCPGAHVWSAAVSPPRGPEGLLAHWAWREQGKKPRSGWGHQGSKACLLTQEHDRNQYWLLFVLPAQWKFCFFSFFLVLFFEEESLTDFYHVDLSETSFNLNVWMVQWTNGNVCFGPCIEKVCHRWFSMPVLKRCVYFVE